MTPPDGRLQLDISEDDMLEDLKEAVEELLKPGETEESSCMPGTLPLNFGEYSSCTLGITVNLSLGRGERLKDIFIPVCGQRDGLVTRLQNTFREAFSEDERFLFLAYASVVYHELRHFHDYLLSPIGVMDGIDCDGGNQSSRDMAGSLECELAVIGLKGHLPNSTIFDVVIIKC